MLDTTKLTDIPPTQGKGRTLVIESTLPRTTCIKLFLLICFHNWLFYLCLMIYLIATVLSFVTDTNRQLLLFIWILFGFYIVNRITAAVYNGFSSKNSIFFLPTRYICDNEGISASTSLTQSTAKWDAIIEWKIIAGCYVLFLSIITFIAIPKSTIQPQDVSTFESFLYNKVKKK